MSNEDNNKISKVAILGGSFNPPTIAHIKIASEIYNLCDDIDEVWLIPCGDNRSDKKVMTSAVHRFKMLELVKNDFLSDDLPIYINDFELKKSKYVPTYFLMKELESCYKNKHFVFCVGMDLVSGLITWDEGEKLLEEVEFIIIDRESLFKEEDIKSNTKFPKKYRKVHLNINGSSTEIRDRLSKKISSKKDLCIGGLTSKSVIKYIKDNNLYDVNN